MKTLHIETTRSLGLIPRSATLIAVLAGALVLALPQAQANETVTWHRQALGQEFTCTGGAKWYWPNNNNWSQAQVMGNPCSEGIVVQQPSNWSTTNYPNGANYDVVLGSWGGAPADLDLQVTLNSLTIQSDGGLTMRNGSRLTANTISFLGDGGITLSGGNGLPPVITLANGGTMIKSSGIGMFVLDPGMALNSYGGHFSVASGTLALPGSGTYTNGDFAVASSATLALVPAGHSATFAGLFTGSGAGTVLMNGGTLAAGPDGATLNFPGTLFQWTGGTMLSMANLGTITVSGGGGVGIGGVFNNSGTLQFKGSAGLNEPWGSGFNNLGNGTVDFQTDAGFSIGGGGGGNPYLNNWGLVRKSGGTNQTVIASLFNNQGGTMQVDIGTLRLAGGGSSSNGAFIVAAGAVLDPTGGGSATWAGEVRGSGAGQVLLSSGTLSGNPSLTLNLPAGLFQWAGGQLAGTMINSNTITLTVSSAFSRAGVLYNRGLFRHIGTTTLAITGDSHFENQAGGIYDLEGDGGIVFGGGSGATPYFNNSGLLRKSGGTNQAVIASLFNNRGGTIQADSGKLVLSGGSGSNGTFIVAAGAVLDPAGGGSATWAGEVRGSGAGQVLLSSGTLSGNPSLTLNLPAGLFQWAGGQLGGTTINSNVVILAASSAFGRGGVLLNRGLFRHTGTVTLALPGDSHFENQAGGIYDLEGDGGIVLSGGSGANPYFNNVGLLRKSGGSGTATVGAPFSNLNGSIEVDSGTLGVGDYTQGSGALSVTLGGRGPGQCGRLSASGSASLSGPLTVSLANGFAPAPGDSFQILSCGGRSGVFSTLNVPAGLAVSYGNNSVSLVVTGAVPVQIVGPALSGGNLVFSFGTVTNQSYTIQFNDVLSTNDWRYYTNLTGDGALRQIVAPATNRPGRFFRVRQP